MATQVFTINLAARVAYGRLETRLNALLSVAVLVVSMGGDSGKGDGGHVPPIIGVGASMRLSPNVCGICKHVE